MESAWYVLCYLYCGNLRWCSLDQANEEAIRSMKKGMTSEDWLQDGLSENLVKGSEYIRSLGFEETPQYGFLVGLLEDCI